MGDNYCGTAHAEFPVVEGGIGGGKWSNRSNHFQMERVLSMVVFDNGMDCFFIDQSNRGK